MIRWSVVNSDGIKFDMVIALTYQSALKAAQRKHPNMDLDVKRI